MARTEWIHVELIDVSSKQRSRICPRKVARHRISFEQDTFVEPIDIVAHANHGDEMRYRIMGNGRHRYLGAIQAGMAMIECRIHDSRLDT